MSNVEKPVKVEFIESYIKGVNGSADYQWNDNHGELIRCKNCKNYEDTGLCLVHRFYQNEDWYCASANKNSLRKE